MLAEAGLADIPVILLSAARDLPRTEPLQAAGALQKPVELAQLLEMLEGQILDTCALCHARIGDDRRTLVVRGALAAAVCASCRGSAAALEAELGAVLDRFAGAPRKLLS
jgi:hypothetical protein